MQEEIEISTSSDEKGWLGKIKDIIYENWQTILIALVVLIVGISAYNYNQKPEASSDPAIIQNQTPEENTQNNEVDIDQQEEYVEENDQQVAQNNEQQKETKNNNEQQTQEIKVQDTNTVESDSENYKVTAVKGDGITHLARKALDKYLSENKDEEITNLHKIYIEDYLQNRIGSKKIEIGYEETFSKKLIEEAIVSSKELSQASLDNLKKYVQD